MIIFYFFNIVSDVKIDSIRKKISVHIRPDIFHWEGILVTLRGKVMEFKEEFALSEHY